MEVLKTDTFDAWLKKLKDRRAKAVIQVHINRIIENNLGKAKSIQRGIFEKKVNYGPGYRLYFTKHKQQTIILLCGGDKSSQQKDISTAIKLDKEVKKLLRK
jgi:putative addiction module killer protein